MIIKGSIYTPAGGSFKTALKLTYKWLHATWLWRGGWIRRVINRVTPKSLTLTKVRRQKRKRRSYSKLEGYMANHSGLCGRNITWWLTSLLAFYVFPPAGFISSATPFILSRRKCWIEIKKRHWQQTDVGSTFPSSLTLASCLGFLKPQFHHL